MAIALIFSNTKIDRSHRALAIEVDQFAQVLTVDEMIGKIEAAVA